MHWLGLLGAPRRVPFSIAAYTDPTWMLPQIFTGIGGSILFFGSVFFFITVLGTAFGKQKLAVELETPVAEPEVDSSHTPAWLDNWKLWIILAVVLVVIGYGPVLADLFKNIQLIAPGFKVW